MSLGGKTIPSGALLISSGKAGVSGDTFATAAAAIIEVMKMRLKISDKVKRLFEQIKWMLQLTALS